MPDTIDDGGMAFPVAYDRDEISDIKPGLTKREYFAAAIMTGMFSDANDAFGSMGHDGRADYAFEQADAMIVRSKL